MDSIHWNQIFAHVCWTIWTNRFSKVFEARDMTSEDIIRSSIHRFIKDNHSKTEAWRCRANKCNAEKLNASLTRTVVLKCWWSLLAQWWDTVWRDSLKWQRNWTNGFNCRMQFYLCIIANHGTIKMGLQMCWNSNLRDLPVQTDSVEAMEFNILRLRETVLFRKFLPT